MQGSDLLIPDLALMPTLRPALRPCGTIAVIPAVAPASVRSSMTDADPDRWRVQACLAAKVLRPIAARYDKLARNILSAIGFGPGMAFWR